jgi:hypothetical protein
MSNYYIESSKQNAVDVANEIINDIKRKPRKWDDITYKRQYFKSYHQNSEIMNCDVCHKEYKKSSKTKHLISKRHLEFLNKTF